MTARAPLGPLLRAFFADHLLQQKAVSPQTMRSVPECAADCHTVVRSVRSVAHAGVRRPDVSRPGHSPQTRASATGPLPDTCGNGRHPDGL